MSAILQSIPQSPLPFYIPRSVLKTATYSVMHMSVAVSVAFALTGSLKAALAIGLIEPLVQTFAYAGHEKVWARFGG